MALTHQQIAKLAHTNATSVSFVLSNKWENRVRPDVRERILRVVRDHGYHVHITARGLAMKRHFRVGLISPGQPAFFAGMGDASLAILQWRFGDILGRYHYAVVAVNIGPAEPLLHAFAQVDRASLDGAFLVEFDLCPEFLDRVAEYLDAKGIPFVVLNEEPKRRRFNFLAVNRRGLAERAVSRFIELGHRRIGMIVTYEGPEHVPQALEGYRLAHERAGLRPVERELIRYTAGGGPVGIRKATEALLAIRDRPTAIFCTDIFGSMGLLEALKLAGVDIGHEMEVIAYGSDRHADLTDPPVSYFRQPLMDSLEEASAFLLKRMENLQDGGRFEKLVSCDYVQRATCR